MQDEMNAIRAQIRAAEEVLAVAKIKAGDLLAVRPKRDRDVEAIERAMERIGRAARRVERLYSRERKIEQAAFFC